MKMIKNVDDEKCQISLLDGSVWLINPGDLPSAVCWLPAQNVEVKKSSGNRFFNYVMTNEDSVNQEISVKKLS